MGNQISTAGRKKSRLPFRKEKVLASAGPEEENLSQQETLKPTSTKSSRFTNTKFTLPGSGSPSSSAATATVPTIVSLPKEATGTDGASTPKDEPYHINIPAPSLMTDAQYLALSLDTVSPSSTSTITQGILETMGPPQCPSTPEPSLVISSRPSSSSSSSKLPTLDQLLSSSESLPFRYNPLFPIGTQKLEKVPAPPLSPAHYSCYQSHQRMLVSQNARHPVPCMVCRVEDEQMRWKCVWCCLRICGACMDGLNKIERRDLRTLVKKSAATDEEDVTSTQGGNERLDLNEEIDISTNAAGKISEGAAAANIPGLEGKEPVQTDRVLILADNVYRGDQKQPS